MKSFSVDRYHKLHAKYRKYKRRLDSAIESGRFKEYRRYKQYQLVRRIRKIQRQLQDLVQQIKLAGLGAAIGLAAVAVNPAMAQDPQSTITVNQVGGSVSKADIAMDEDGDYVVVWRNNDFVYAQLFNKYGNAEGNNIQVASLNNSNQDPKVAMEADGDFIVAWQDYKYDAGLNDSYNQIWVKRFFADGSDRTSEYGLVRYGAGELSIATDDDGDITAVAYDYIYGDYAPGATEVEAIYVKMPNNSGLSWQNSAIGSSVTSSYPGFANISPDISMDADGDFVVVYESRSYYVMAATVYYGAARIRASRFYNDGVAKAGPIEVRRFSSPGNYWGTGDPSEPSVSMDEQGNFVVSSADRNYNSYSSSYGVRWVAEFNSSGAYQSSSSGFFPNNSTFATDVASDGDGDYAWVIGEGTSIETIWNGNLNSINTSNYGIDAAVAIDKSGNFTVAWNEGDYIYSKLVSVVPPLVVGDANPVANTNINEVRPKVAIDGNGNHVVVWLEDNLEAQVFDVNGNALTTAQTITTNVFQDNFDVDMDEEGDFIVTWQRNSVDEVRFAVYSLDDTYVSYSFGGYFDGTNPAVSMDSDGDFVIAYEDYYFSGLGYNTIEAKFYTKTGSAGINYGSISTGNNNFDPDVAIDEMGEAVIVWRNDDTYLYNPYIPGSAFYSEIRFRRAKAFAPPQAIRAVQYAGIEIAHTSPSVGIDDDGDFVVVWNRRSAGTSSIQQRRFGSDDNGIGGSSNVQVFSNSNGGNANIEPYIAMGPEGDYVVSTMDNLDGSYGSTANQIILHRYDGGGNKIETINFPTLTTDSYNHRGAPIAGNDKSTYAVVWQDEVAGDEDINSKLLINSITNWNPTTIFLTAADIDENLPANTVIGTISTEDLNPGDVHTYTLTTFDGGGADNSSFSIINGNELVGNEVFDAEDQTSYSIQITTDDGNGGAAYADFNITINNLPDPPVITNANANATEGATTIISDFALAVTDQDTNFDDIRIVLNSLPQFGTLSLDGTQLSIGSEFFKSDIDANKVSYSHDGSESDTDSFTFTLDDGNTFLNDQQFTFNIQLDNDTPVAVNAGASVDEGGSHNFTIDELGAIDADTPENQLVFTVTFLPANGFIEVNGLQIESTGSSFTLANIQDGAVTYSHDGSESDADSFTFDLTDGFTFSNGNIFNITIDAFNDTPRLDVNQELSVLQGQSAIITNSELLTTDVDNTPSELIYTLLVSPASGTILKNGVEISIDDTFTQEDINNGIISYQHDNSSISSDSFGFKITDGEKEFIVSGGAIFDISIITGNSAPTDITLSNSTISEDQEPGTAVGILSTVDPDAGDTHSYTLSGEDAASFNINVNRLESAVIFDFETKSSYSITITSTDAGGLSTSNDFVINVNDPNRPVGNNPPTDIFLSNSVIPETAGANTVVGRFSTEDLDTDDTFDYELLEGTDNFNISGNQLRLNGSLGPEAYPIRVRSTDEGDVSVEASFSITVKGTAEVAQEVEEIVSYGAQTENFRLLSMPFNSIPAADVFPDLTSGDFGVTWRIVQYRNGGESDATSFSAGRGYWFLALEPTTIEVQAADASTLNNNGEFEMSLTTGWNIIGNPFLTDIGDWGAIIQYNKDQGYISTGDILNDEVIYKYNGSGFPIDNDLLVFEGAWIEANGSITIRIPLNSNSRLASGSEGDKRLESYFDSQSNWQLIFDVQSGGQQLKHAGFGIRPDASEERDAFDLSTPPSMDENFGLKFKEFSTGLTKNLVNPTEGYAWRFKVSDPGSDINLQWDKNLLSSLDVPVYLVVPSTSEFFDMKKIDQLTLDRSVGEVQVLYGNAQAETSGIFSNIYPNPASDRVTLDILDLDSDGRNLTDVDRNREYEIEIFGLDGQLKFSQPFVSEQSSFRHTVENLQLNSGVYLYRLKTKTTTTNPLKLIVK